MIDPNSEAPVNSITPDDIAAVTSVQANMNSKVNS